MWRFPSLYASCLVAGLGLALAGCEQAKTEVKKAVQQTKKTVTQQTQKVADKVQQKLNLVGHMDLELTPPVKTKGCYARVIALAGRPTVLQLSSYRVDTHDPKSEPPLPAILIQAQVDAADPAQLAGKTVRAQLFVQERRNGRVLFTDAGQSVDLAIKSIEGQQVTAEIAAGMLTNSETRAASPVRGTLVGILQ